MPLQHDEVTHGPAEALRRCWWAGTDPLMVDYHDTEWGVPVRDDWELFERLMLEGFQAGLSWSTILRKRDAFAHAFAGWDPVVIAAYGETDVARLLADAGIVRNQLKIAATIRNALVFLQVQEVGSFSDLVWSVVGGAPLIRRPANEADVPASTPESAALSRELKRHGFTFVGPTICYAFMQSVGIVDDHVATCFRAHPLG